MWYTSKFNRIASVEGAVTSLGIRGSGHHFFVGTSTSQIYLFQFSDFSQELLGSCHYDTITDICFPRYTY